MTRETGQLDITRSISKSAGFSLPLVLVASLMVLLGGLVLVDRSSDGLISAAFQGESGEAKDAAETGLTRIVGELNRQKNRGLLAKSTSGADPDGYRWVANSADTPINTCLGTPAGKPDLTSTTSSIGYGAGTYNWVYLDAGGQVVATAAQATKAYRLLWVKRQPLVDADGNPLLKIFQPTGRGTVTLAVEGSALRNGQTVSSVRLEEVLQLVPKCCGVPFGGSHGNVNYGTGSDGSSVCYAGGNWGFAGGVAGNNTGYIKINGVTTIQTGEDPPQPVNPITCIADSTAQCSFDPTSTPYTLQVTPTRLGPVPEFEGPAVTAGRIERSGGSLSPDIKSSTTAFATCLDSSNVLVPDCSAAATATVVLNAAVAEGPEHPFCKIYTQTADGQEALHCKLAVLDYSAFNIRVINTNVRPLRLYFPDAGAVVSSGGGKTLTHQAGNKTTDLALFGCRSCSSQTITLAGNVSGVDLLAWFPQGSVTISGGSVFSGVLWANKIVSNGGVTWTVPGSGVAQAMELAGYGVPADDATTTDGNPLVFDWVARAVERFRWFGR